MEKLHGEFQVGLTVHDVEVYPLSSSHPIWIREIVDSTHPRIDRLWWALYDGGRRSDIWYFTASPGRTDNKMLSNYRLLSVTLPTKDSAVFRVRGEMSRPQGAWWIMGKELKFSVSAKAIVLTGVRDAFSLFRDYDIGEAPPSISISTEREVGGRYEIRSMADTPDKTLRACGFRDPMLEDRLEFSWKRVEKITQCVTSSPKASVSFRNQDTTSFIERGK